MKQVGLIVLLFWNSCVAFAQFTSPQNKRTANPINRHSVGKSLVIPALLIGTGWYAMKSNSLINRYELREERNEYSPLYRHHEDDFLQYSPIAVAYGLQLAGVKPKHDFVNGTVMLLKSELIMLAITYPLKKFIAEPRPDTGAPNSFPSGHTAQAFAAATFLSKEYGYKSAWYGIGAYTIATGVGVMRMMNNRHWISDVLTGAGIGILSTNIAYLTHRYKWGKNKKKGSTLILPNYTNKTGVISLIHRF